MFQTANELRYGSPHQLIIDEADAAALKTASGEYPSHTLSPRQTCDLELLLNGGFSPLTGFMDRQTYEKVIEEMRLGDGAIWPMPIVLDVNKSLAETLAPGGGLALQDDEGFTLAVLDVEDIWKPDKRREAEKVYGTTSQEHPGVRALFEDIHDHYVGGASPVSSYPCIPITRNSDTRQPNCVVSSKSSAGGALSDFIPVSPCTACSGRSPYARPRPPRPISCYTPS
uniref:PUA-like domain-containing protein n=1 Tax=Candidatus Kentrum sp. SD TaxID=2126332 RepID=A0A450YG58_9GAMM|nr:MAG: PUA-like domain-containing protein [Candidatus Kentron sp. SD]VFK40530.1 MAG: PUA-like domain-containing protein [Candidatus Kentron sp. SD]